MQEYWELYLKTLDGAPAIVSFNAGIAEEAVRENLMVMGFIKLKMHTPDDKGMISKEEETKLSFIEDSIEMAVLRYTLMDSMMAGRVPSLSKLFRILDKILKRSA